MWWGRARKNGVIQRQDTEECESACRGEQNDRETAEKNTPDISLHMIGRDELRQTGLNCPEKKIRPIQGSKSIIP